MGIESDLVWFDGELVPYADANIHVLSHTLHYGLGVFEGIRSYRQPGGGGGVFKLDEHIRRLFDLPGCDSSQSWSPSCALHGLLSIDTHVAWVVLCFAAVALPGSGGCTRGCSKLGGPRCSSGGVSISIAGEATPSGLQRSRQGPARPTAHAALAVSHDFSSSIRASRCRLVASCSRS